MLTWDPVCAPPPIQARRYGKGCDGGDVIDVVRYMKHYGLPDESCQVGQEERKKALGPPCLLPPVADLPAVCKLHCMLAGNLLLI